MADLDRWIVRTPHNHRVRARLVCVPFAGAGASLFRLWAQAAPPELEVCRVQLPGREERSREPLVTSIREVVAALAPALADGPDTAIFGHSLGGLIGFELALALTELGHPPLRFFPSGARPPHVPDPYQLHRLSEPALIEALRARGGVQEEVLAHPELREMALPLLRADLELAETFCRAEPHPLPVPITVCASPQDAVIPWQVTAGWQAYSTHELERYAFEGDHFFVRQSAAIVRDFVFGRLLGMDALKSAQ